MDRSSPTRRRYGPHQGPLLGLGGMDLGASILPIVAAARRRSESKAHGRTPLTASASACGANVGWAGCEDAGPDGAGGAATVEDGGPEEPSFPVNDKRQEKKQCEQGSLQEAPSCPS